jgi:hypothetical protein
VYCCVICTRKYAAGEAGKELGLKIQDAGSGGASDDNTTPAMDIPTLDGLGAGGGLAHNTGEFSQIPHKYIQGLVSVLHRNSVTRR